METKCIGGLTDSKWGGQYHQQHRVYSMGDIALALNAQIPGGSYWYMEIKRMGKEIITTHIPHGYLGLNADNSGISPTIDAGISKWHTLLVEKECVRMIGRDPNNPSDRTSGNPNLEQMLEVREDGCTGTLTTVQKDNMVLIKQATKDGYIPCLVGGGGGFTVSQQPNKERKSDRQRNDKPNTNNGEYP